MTITLTWWMLPIFLIIGAFLYAQYDYEYDGGFLRGMRGMFIFFICFVFAIAFTIGHFV